MAVLVAVWERPPTSPAPTTRTFSADLSAGKETATVPPTSLFPSTPAPPPRAAPMTAATKKPPAAQTTPSAATAAKPPPPPQPPPAAAHWTTSAASASRRVSTNHGTAVDSEAMRRSISGNLGSISSPPPVAVGNMSGVNIGRRSLSMPSEVPTPPKPQTPAGGAAAAPGAASAVKPSRLAWGPAEAGTAKSTTQPPSGTSTAAAGGVEAWRVRSAALRAEAEAMLSGMPDRARKPTAPGSDTDDKASSDTNVAWVYRYLLYEPLLVSTGTAGNNYAHTRRLAGSAAAEAVNEDAIYEATFGNDVGAPVSLIVRLFPSVAPKSVTVVHSALRNSATQHNAAVVAQQILSINLPGGLTTTEAATEAKLHHERSGLLSLRTSYDGHAMPTGGFGSGGGGGASLAFCLGP